MGQLISHNRISDEDIQENQFPLETMSHSHYIKDHISQSEYIKNSERNCSISMAVKDMFHI